MGLPLRMRRHTFRMEDFMTNLYANDRFFEELFGFRREVEEMFHRLGNNKTWEPRAFRKTFNFAPAVETFVDKEAKKYVCRVALPGVEPRDVHIQAQGNVLTIRGERKLMHSTKEVELLEGEVVYGSFERTFTLPEGVVVDKLNAEYVNGVLEITAPVAAAALPRRIEIRTAQPLIKQAAA
jgi:HSP20 family protein